MKSFLFITVLITLLGSGVYIALPKLGIELEDAAIPGLNKLTGNETDIMPFDQWRDALIGKWKFENRQEDNEYLHLYEGEVEYKPDGKFTAYITYKFYHCNYMSSPPPEVKPNCLHIVAGGGYSGKWGVDSLQGYWLEDIQTCNINSSRVDEGYNSGNLCKNEIPLGSTKVYGNYIWENEKDWIKIFTKNRIVIEGKNFTNDSEIRYDFERLNIVEDEN